MGKGKVFSLGHRVLIWEDIKIVCSKALILQILIDLLMVNIASSAEVRLKPSYSPKSMLEEDGYSEGLSRTAKAELIKGGSFLFHISRNLQVNGRFLEHHLEKAVKCTGAPAVT